MADTDNCALNTDGTLKDAQEIQFFNSPSDKHPISSTVPRSISEDDELPTVANISRGLKGKAPARIVGGSRRIIKPSLKIREQTPSTIPSFFTKRYAGKVLLLYLHQLYQTTLPCRLNG